MTNAAIAQSAAIANTTFDDTTFPTGLAATGGHGYGMRDTDHPVNSWPTRCVDWMTKQGYLKR